MRRNAIVLGGRSFENDYNRIMGAGEVNITNSNIKKAYLAGELNINNSSVRKLRIAGEINGKELALTKVKLIGEATLEGICKADTFSVIGELKAENLECRLLKNGKIKKGRINENITWSGYIKAVTFENFQEISLSFEYDFNNIISSALLQSEKEISCDNFYSFDGLIAPSINAENITILINDNIAVESLVGTKITVKTSFTQNKAFKTIPKMEQYRNKTNNSRIVSIPQIEGDNIFIENIKSDFISGNEVVIGDLCVIEKVEYIKNIKISDKAVVNEVIKL